jgi:hypothetical protein
MRYASCFDFLDCYSILPRLGKLLNDQTKNGKIAEIGQIANYIFAIWPKDVDFWLSLILLQNENETFYIDHWFKTKVKQLLK